MYLIENAAILTHGGDHVVMIVIQQDAYYHVSLT